MSCFFSSEKILRPHSCCPPTTLIMFFLLEFLSIYQSSFNDGSSNRQTQEYMRQAHHHSLSPSEGGSDGTTISPLRTNTSHVMQVRRGDQCPELFFVPNTWEDNTTNTFHSPLSENIKEHAQQQRCVVLFYLRRGVQCPEVFS